MTSINTGTGAPDMATNRLIDAMAIASAKQIEADVREAQQRLNRNIAQWLEFGRIDTARFVERVPVPDSPSDLYGGWDMTLTREIVAFPANHPLANLELHLAHAGGTIVATVVRERGK